MRVRRGCIDPVGQPGVAPVARGLHQQQAQQHERHHPEAHRPAVSPVPNDKVRFLIPKGVLGTVTPSALRTVPPFISVSNKLSEQLGKQI